MNSIYLNYLINSLKLGLLLSIIVASFMIARTSMIVHSEIATAVTIDLTLSFPILYLVFIRKTKISRLTVFPLFVFGLIFASFILPVDNRNFLNFLKLFTLPIIELAILGFVGYVVYKSRKTYQAVNSNSNDVMENLRETLVGEFSMPLVAKVLAFEVGEFYYALVGWKSKRGEKLFSYHKENGVIVVISTLIFLIAIETFALHLLVAKWNSNVAWFLTLLSLYFLFQLFAHGKAIFLRPIEITDEKLFIRCGLLGDAAINLKNIEKVEIVTNIPQTEENTVNLSSLGKFTTPNIKISLCAESFLNGVYGKQRYFKSIFLAIDEADKFKGKIEDFITKKQK